VVTQPWSEEYQTDFLDMHHRVFDRVDAVVGEHVWNFADFADFATASSVGRVAGNKKGVFTRDRIPTAAAFAPAAAGAPTSERPRPGIEWIPGLRCSAV